MRNPEGVFRTSVDAGRMPGQEWLGAAAERAAGDVSFASAAEATRRDRAVVVAVVGAEGMTLTALVVGPRCQLVSTPWNLDTGSNKPRGTSISYERSSGALSSAASDFLRVSSGSFGSFACNDKTRAEIAWRRWTIGATDLPRSFRHSPPRRD
jgi:hypothetical protein